MAEMTTRRSVRRVRPVGPATASSAVSHGSATAANGHVAAGSRRECAAELWLHLHLPRLPLEALLRGVDAGQACVVVERGQRRATVLCCDRQATTLGIRPGMALAAAHVLGEFQCLERDRRAEQHALERLCQWAVQFSPVVSMAGEDGLVIEIRGSLRLFGGLDGLLARVRHGLRELGYRAEYAVAPTPLAAGLLARARPREVVTESARLAASLAGLPLAALRLSPAWEEALAQLGVRQVGECRRLPRAGLARRLSPDLVSLLDRLFGELADPRPALALPTRFESSIELPWEVDNARGLMRAVERLVRELASFLTVRQAATRRLCWLLRDRNGRHESLPLELARPMREAEHLLVLMRELLARKRLAAPVRALALTVDEFSFDFQAPARDLFGLREPGDGEAYAAFVDRLRARYGEDALHGLRLGSSHDPARISLQTSARPAPRFLRQGLSHACAGLAPRPLWLLQRPVRLHTRQGQPLFHGPLQLAPERERIQHGWWHGQRLARDYFIARHADGERLWVYRELEGTRDWFLHGIFD